MRPPVHAIISWIPANKGGRKSIPVGPSYSTVVRFDEDTTWPHNAWSLRVDFLRSFGDGRFLHARVSFLTDEAPVEVLHPGSRFELYEGRRMVATGQVREENFAPHETNEFEMSLLH